ncbi:aquaporin [Mycoplasma corogypsi]|uniref:aquaporin n=1 Tax=Mycoplasma corogypsi TaxID=2106 RepID=UPI00387320E4
MTQKSSKSSDFWIFFKSFFSFYKLTQERRKNAEKPKDIRTWLIHGVSEFIGTIFIALSLAGLSLYIGKESSKNFTPIIIEDYLLHPILVGFYAGFVVVALCLFIFLRWSCDLNPAVSFMRYLNGTNNGYYTTYKILIQALGGVVAGAIIFAVGSVTAPELNGVKILPNAPIDAISAAKKAFPLTTTPTIASGTAWIFFVELVMTSILLFPIFSPNINNKYRDLFIMFVISMSVWMGLLGGSAAINPARGLSQQLPALFVGPTSESIKAHVNLAKFATLVNTGNGDIVQASTTLYYSIIAGTVIMIIADFLAPVFYLFVQGITQSLINPLIVKIIAYKNFKSQFMTKPADLEKDK